MAAPIAVRAIQDRRDVRMPCGSCIRHTTMTGRRSMEAWTSARARTGASPAASTESRTSSVGSVGARTPRRADSASAAAVPPGPA